MSKTKVTGNLWTSPQMPAWEDERDKNRQRLGRVTFDCFHAVATDDRVKCSKGVELRSDTPDGSMYLLAIIRGRTSSYCLTCQWYEGEET